MTTATNISAGVGGGKPAAVALTADINRVKNLSADGDSVKLQAASLGATVTVINASGYDLQVFSTGSDLLKDSATTPVYIPPGKVGQFFCGETGVWDAQVG
jgi:hypothetical protein